MEDIPTIYVLSLICFVLWGSLYVWYAHNCSDEVPEFHSRVITFIHSFAASVVGISQCKFLTYEKFEACHLHESVTPSMYALMIWSWGYFAFDLLWCIIYWPSNTIMKIHHISALGAISLYMNKPNSGCVFSCGLAMMEITNPLLQFRWFLKHTKNDNNPLFTAIEVTYLVSFVGLRGVFGTYLIYKILKTNLLDTQAKIASLSLYIVSMSLIMQIFGYVLYKYKADINEFCGILNEMGIILDEQY